MKRSGWSLHLLTLGLMLTLLAAVALPAAPALALQEFPHGNAWGRATPSVIWCGDPASTVKFEVHITGRTDVARVWVTDMGTDEEEERAELYDDGTHGDQSAGDNLFTLADVVVPCSPDFILSRGGTNQLHFMLRVELDDGTYTGNNYGIAAVGMVHTDFRHVFSVQTLGEGLSATAYAFFIEDRFYEVMDGYPVADIQCGKGNYEAFRKLYSVLPDVFDFAMVVPGTQLLRQGDYGENVPYDVLVTNEVEHIGMSIKDNSALFGSAGRLKSAIYHSFGSLDIFDHEVGHTWGMAIGQSLGLINEDWDVDQGHWDEMTDIRGQMSAFFFDNSGAIGHFADNGDGTWRLTSNMDVEPYSPLELYVMGLIPPEEVPDIHILSAPDTSDLARISAASRTVTMDQILAAEGGARYPTYAESQKEFTLAMIVTQDLPYNDAAYAYFSLMARSLQTTEAPEGCCLAPFYWATGGRATLSTLLPVGIPDPLVEVPATEVSPSPTPEVIPPEVTDPTVVPAETEAPVSPLCGSIIVVALLVLPALWSSLRRQ